MVEFVIRNPLGCRPVVSVANHALSRLDQLRDCEGVLCLIVAIEYQRGRLHLPGTRNDMLLMTNALTARGVPAENITQLFDARADRAGILRELQRLRDASRNCSAVVISMSCHGVQTPDRLGHERDGLSECLVPYQESPDRLDRSTLVHDHELAAIAREFDPACAVVWVFDCCHSGTMLDEELVRSAAHGRAPAPMVCIASTRDHEVALAVGGVGRLILALTSRTATFRDLHGRSLSEWQVCQVTWLRGPRTDAHRDAHPLEIR